MEIFNNNYINDIKIKEPIKIISDTNSKHKITLIKNLPFDMMGMRNELKVLKKLLNCNGSLIILENIIMLQGYHNDKLKQYYINKGFEVSF
jgi:translation initiation factor 1 (eIF-1/SUI1)